MALNPFGSHTITDTFYIDSVPFQIIWYRYVTNYPFRPVPSIRLIRNNNSTHENMESPTLKLDVRFLDLKGDSKYQKTLIPVFCCSNGSSFEHLFVDCPDYSSYDDVEITVTQSYHLEIGMVWTLWTLDNNESKHNSYMQFLPEEVVEDILEFLK